MRGVSASRGPNWVRNNKSRDKKRRAAGRRETALGSDSGVDVVGVGRGVEEEQKGFWRSCSQETRQKLIESKAAMHIAENERRARKARADVERMDSPTAILKTAMQSVKLARQCAESKGESAVAGWAETVATSHAESVARSAPSSVPSYASVVSGASSVSVDGTKRVKPGSFHWFQKRVEGVKTVSDVLRVSKELRDQNVLNLEQRLILVDQLEDIHRALGTVKVNRFDFSRD